MELSVVAIDPDCVRIRCVGEVNMLDVASGVEPIARLLGPSIYSNRVLMDLEQATYMDSTGLGWLIRAHKHFRENKGMLVIHSIPPRIGQVIDLMRLNKVLHLADSVDAARRLLAGGKS